MPPTPLGNRDLIRSINRSVVLNAIKTHGPIARTQLARRTGLSPATITGIAAELIEDDLVFEKEIGDSRGGRRPILLAINPAGGYVVGIKLTEDRAIGALTDLEALVLVKRTDPLEEKTPQAVTAALARLADELLRKAGLPRKKLLGVGVGLAGIVDSERGVLRRSPFFGWRDLPLRDLLQEQLRVPVYVDNDVNTLTLAEKWFGAGQGVDHFLVVTVGRGVGMGMVINGQIYRGGAGGAGEFGHTVVDLDGPPCDCGKRGCLETIVGYPGLLRAAGEAHRRGELPAAVEDIDALLALAARGDPAARGIVARAGRQFGLAVANLINLFDPQRIIIGGEGVRMAAPFFDPMVAAIRGHVMPGLENDAEIRIEPWGDDAWARGAASLVLRELFESPVHREAGPNPAQALAIG